MSFVRLLLAVVILGMLPASAWAEQDNPCVHMCCTKSKITIEPPPDQHICPDGAFSADKAKVTISDRLEGEVGDPKACPGCKLVTPPPREATIDTSALDAARLPDGKYKPGTYEIIYRVDILDPECEECSSDAGASSCETKSYVFVEKCGKECDVPGCKGSVFLWKSAGDYKIGSTVTFSGKFFYKKGTLKDCLSGMADGDADCDASATVVSIEKVDDSEYKEDYLCKDSAPSQGTGPCDIEEVNAAPKDFKIEKPGVYKVTMNYSFVCTSPTCETGESAATTAPCGEATDYEICYFKVAACNVKSGNSLVFVEEDGDSGNEHKSRSIFFVGQSDAIVSGCTWKVKAVECKSQLPDEYTCKNKCETNVTKVETLDDVKTYAKFVEFTGGSACSNGDGGVFDVAWIDIENKGGTDGGGLPRIAQALPRRSGSLYDPVIQMNSGGDGFIGKCSLYGTVICPPNKNVWSFTAVAQGLTKDTWSDDGLAKGHTARWYDNGKTVGEGKDITLTLQTGKHIIRLAIFRNSATDPDDPSNKEKLVGEAEIHSIEVELISSGHVSPPPNSIADLPEDEKDEIGDKGLFYVKAKTPGGFPVDALIGCKTGITNRGRVSLDGYPQNQYWTGKDDLYDLPQACMLQSGVAATVSLQGYVCGTVGEQKVQLEVYGQAHLERCGSCGPPIDAWKGWPIDSVWQLADTEMAGTHGLSLDMLLEEPHLSNESPADGEGGVLKASADCVVEIAGANPGPGILLSARLAGMASASSNEPDRSVTWTVKPGGGNATTVVRLMDYEQNGNAVESNTLDTKVEGDTTYLYMDWSHLVGGKARVRAGDVFTVEASYQDPVTGQKLSKSRTIEVVPGIKAYHIPVVDGKTPGDLTNKSIEDIVASYGAAYVELPIKSEEVKTFTVFVYDRFFNPLADGTDVTINLTGSGLAGGYNPTTQDKPDPAKDMRVVVGAGGAVKVKFTQQQYATCPWSPEKPGAELQTDLRLAIDNSLSDALRAQLTEVPTEKGPGDLVLSAALIETYADPDIRLNGHLPIQIRVTRDGIPQKGVTVNVSSINGKVTPSDPVTNDSGEVACALTAQGASVGPILVTAALAGKSVVVTPNAAKWVSSAETVVTIDHPVLVTDKDQNGFIEVDTLDDAGEAADVPGATEGDDKLKVPYYVETDVHIQGIPKHRYRLATVVSADAGVTYPLDVIAEGGLTPPRGTGDPAAIVGGSMLTEGGINSSPYLALAAGDSLAMPTNLDAGPVGGRTIGFWLNPSSVTGAVCSNPGSYSLELSQGRLALTVNTSQGMQTLVHSRVLPVATWSYVELRFDGRTFSILTGSAESDTDAQHADLDIGSEFVSQNAQSGLVFLGMAMHLDMLRVSEQPDSSGVITGGGAGGYITTDEQGRATFTVRARPNQDKRFGAPRILRISVSGSEDTKVEIQETSSGLWGRLVSAGKAFLTGSEGLGKNAGWLEKASAWASEILPFASDMRTLAFEIYKAGSGCDKVSKLNLTFAVVGLCADALTFGTAGPAVKGTKAVYATAKELLKQTALSGAISLASMGAINGFVELVTKEGVNGEREPRTWVKDSQAFIGDVTLWIKNAAKDDPILKAFYSVDDIFMSVSIYAKLGADGYRNLINEVSSEEAGN